MLNRLRIKAGGESGFTLVELLVVMLILGLLAGIGIPAFLSQREKARDVDAKHDAGIAGLAAETIATENDGNYDGPNGVTVARLRQIEPSLTDSNLSVLNLAAKRYTVRVTSPTGHTFDYTRNGGTVTTSCSPQGQGGCPDDGVWND
jgi:prepilin-type N-terminal cleavage/methylation domain-containing protein